MTPALASGPPTCSTPARRGPLCGGFIRPARDVSLEHGGLRSATHYAASTSQCSSMGAVGSRWPGVWSARRSVATKALFDPPPFQPEKLGVSLADGTSALEPAPPLSRKYTLTHNDITGSLRLTIGSDYNEEQISGFYTRLLRDEVVAEWVNVGSSAYALHVYCHVSGEERWLAPPLLRNYIFRREMPLVLDTLVYADRQLLRAQPELAEAQVYVHFQSTVRELDTVEYWGVLGNRASWPKGPTSILLRTIYAVIGWPASLEVQPADLSIDLPDEVRDVEEAVRWQQQLVLQQLEERSEQALQGQGGQAERGKQRQKQEMEVRQRRLEREHSAVPQAEAQHEAAAAVLAASIEVEEESSEASDMQPVLPQPLLVAAQVEGEPPAARTQPRRPGRLGNGSWSDDDAEAGSSGVGSSSKRNRAETLMANGFNNGNGRSHGSGTSGSGNGSSYVSNGNGNGVPAASLRGDLGRTPTATAGSQSGAAPAGDACSGSEGQPCSGEPGCACGSSEPAAAAAALAQQQKLPAQQQSLRAVGVVSAVTVVVPLDRGPGGELLMAARAVSRSSASSLASSTPPSR